ncbi:MAG: hypothetical protein RH860_04945 [Cytophagales bacterium]
MNQTIVEKIESICISKEDSMNNLSLAWDNIKELHIQFELNPKSLNTEIISPLDKLANYFADLLKEVIHQYDETSVKIGEMSFKVLKLCIRLIDKIYYFNRGGESAYSFN